MSKLAREITIFIVTDFGPTEMLRRVSDPCWFQAFGCVLGYDWHSSGVTTTVWGALKDGIPFPVNRKTYDQSIETLGGPGQSSDSHGICLYLKGEWSLP